MADINIESLAKQVLSSVKGDPAQLTKLLSNTTALQKALGNVKLDNSQLTQLTALLKKSSVAKDLLGSDGKLDSSDVQRLAKEAAKDPSAMLGKAASLFGKK